MEKNGVKIYTKMDDGSNVRSFKGITQVHASTTDVMALIRDYDRYVEWVDAVSSVSVIQTESDTTCIIHVKVKLPFPIADRDIVQRISINYQSDTLFLSFSTVAELIPEEKGYVRMPLSDGHWKIRQLEDQLTEVELVSTNDPGGSVPKWIINMMTTDSPYKTLKNMRSIFED